MNGSAGIRIRMRIVYLPGIANTNFQVSVTAKYPDSTETPVAGGRPDHATGETVLEAELCHEMGFPHLSVHRYKGIDAAGEPILQLLSDLPMLQTVQDVDFGELVVQDDPVCRSGERLYFSLPISLLEKGLRPYKAPLELEIQKLEQEKSSADARARAVVQSELLKKEDTIQELRGIITGQNEVTLKEFILHTRHQIDLATREIENSGYTLGPLQMELRVVPEAAGGFSLPKKEELATIDGSRLSVLNLSFIQGAQKGRSEADTRVPSVVGYTESLARRKLAEVGLTATIIRQVVSLDSKGTQQVGRVITQTPVAGTMIAANGSVTIAIGL